MIRGERRGGAGGWEDWGRAREASSPKTFSLPQHPGMEEAFEAGGEGGSEAGDCKQEGLIGAAGAGLAHLLGRWWRGRCDGHEGMPADVAKGHSTSSPGPGPCGRVGGWLWS